ncbi:MAG TPA: TetR/AcrR family transcriptional regulator C-terminal domain-containing protein [Mycobacteriales bacterium]|nr:TetR/AcrR family transcriptional regulator C-terminal domain-containing protein [Mycobacteriales bacterium]
MPNSKSTAGAAWTRRPRLSQDAIVRAAIRIADSEGLAAVSMRRLATELDARTMTLYSHVAGKDELFDLMFDELARDISFGPDLPPHWRDAITVEARRMREIGLAHPWSLELFGQRAQLGPNTMRLLEERMRALDELDLPAEQAWSVVTVMQDYVTGYVVRETAQANAVPDDPAEAEQWHADISGYFRGLVDSGEFRRIAPLLTRFAAPPDNFEVGLAWLLDSIERRYT